MSEGYLFRQVKCGQRKRLRETHMSHEAAISSGRSDRGDSQMSDLGTSERRYHTRQPAMTQREETYRRLRAEQRSERPESSGRLRGLSKSHDRVITGARGSRNLGLQESE